jgi:DNA mismatch repair protein MutH
MALGARAASRAEPDFPHLGVELKTLPVDPTGKPYESTFVCTAPAGGLAPTWEESWLRRKLSCVLWIPIIGRDAPGDRVVGGAVRWQPDAREEQSLRTDWEALRALLVGGRLDEISGRRGAVLQLRPKGANAADTSWVLDADANWVQEQHRAFYLRPKFTQELLTRALRTQ